MAAPFIEYNGLLEKFDELVSSGVIRYSPTRVERIEEDGLVFDFHITDALSTKPQAEDTVKPEDQLTYFGPGSDILNSDPRLLVAKIHATHLLVVNKFCVFRPQLLLLTADSYRRQSEQLDIDDFKAVCSTLPLLDDPHFAIYNCTSKAGASRQHKHLQIIPRPPRLFPDDRHSDPARIPFRYFLEYVDEGVIRGQMGPAKLLQSYENLLCMAKEALSSFFEDGSCPHNVVLTKEWMIVIPRRSNNFEGLSANAAGMVGSIWLMNDGQLDSWRAKRPRNVLYRLGLPGAQDERE